MLDTQSYFALWQAMDNASTAQELPLILTRALNAEVFSPPLFAAVCSENLRQAAARVAQYKILTGPVTIRVNEIDDQLVLRWAWPELMEPPLPFLLSEMMFWVFIARTCTRMKVNPTHVVTPRLPTSLPKYTDYFGIPVTTSNSVSIAFSTMDARLPFLAANDAIWKAFEPTLRQQFQATSSTTSIIERTRAVLIRAIPATNATANYVARTLLLSPRTLQRQLQAEGTSFKSLLNSTRAQLARHYLLNSDLSLVEVSYLLGYKDASSFNRAFRQWTGKAPNRFRHTQ